MVLITRVDADGFKLWTLVQGQSL